jgi:hypothetical protein
MCPNIEPSEVSSLQTSQITLCISLEEPWLLAIAGLLLGIYKIHDFNKNKK